MHSLSPVTPRRLLGALPIVTAVIAATVLSMSGTRTAVASASRMPSTTLSASPAAPSGTASGPPGTPLNATATPSTISTNVTVSWTPAAGPAATWFTVGAFNPAGSVVGSVACRAACTSLTVPGLPQGGQYAFAVWASNASGASSPAGTSWIIVNGGCENTTFCLRADATSPSGTISHAASGFLHATWALPASATAPLAPTSWRVSIVPSESGWDFSEYDVARQAGASTITVVISDAWFRATSGGCGAPSPTCGAATPWSELPTYSAWVTAYVRLIEATGRRPTYWDIQNEPDAAVASGAYFNSSGAATVTPSNMMALFEAGNRAVKAADPSARVEGPSLSEFLLAPVGNRLDLTTFLDTSAADGAKWDAISWHENGGSYNPPTHWGALPDETIPSDVTAVRALLAAHPTIGTPALAINEFGTQEESVLPGWIAGELIALEQSGVSNADRTCWPTATDPSSPGGCSSFPSTLDELLLSTGDRTAGYQVFAAYAALQGHLIRTTPSDVTFSELGTIDSLGTVQLLIGRHTGCTAAVNADCPFPASWTPAPVDVPLSVTLPWSGSARLLVQRIPNARGSVSSPITVSSTALTITGGHLTVVLPSVADGDVFTVDLQRQ